MLWDVAWPLVDSYSLKRWKGMMDIMRLMSLINFIVLCNVGTPLCRGGVTSNVPVVIDRNAVSGRFDRGRAENIAQVLAVLAQLRLGQSDHAVTQLLEQVFMRSGTNTFIRDIGDLLPTINPACVSQWQSLRKEPDGWPQIILAVFADTNRTSLVDALWFSNGGLRPVVDGIYNHNIVSLKRGESIQMVYQKLGRRQCEYLRTTDGQWKVRFIYCGYGGRYFMIEADAALGVVTYVGDGTL